MPKPIQRDTDLRCAMETINADIAIVRKMMVITRLRVMQAKDRTGLDALLVPALDEIDEVDKAINSMGSQVNAALRLLVSGQR